MIELLPDMPKGVTGVRVSGRLGGDELREVKPAIEDMLKTDEIRIVEVIAARLRRLRARRVVRGPEAGIRHRLAASRERSSALRWCPTRRGSDIPCTRWPG